jgi:hypothetical protein
LEPGIRYYSGTAVYRKTFDVPLSALDSRPSARFLDLGTVLHLARVRLKGRDLGVGWCAPWGVALPGGLLKARQNRLEIQVVNVWANRLIGDEQEPPDCEWLPGHQGHGGFLKQFPEWFLRNQPRPSKGRFTFTTWNYFTKDSPLVPSGLLGPVRLMAKDWTPHPETAFTAKDGSVLDNLGRPSDPVSIRLSSRDDNLADRFLPRVWNETGAVSYE